jgi:hypothetical protein
MDPRTNQNLSARGRGGSILPAPLYGLAASFMLSGLVLAAAPPGVRWGMFLIGYALVVAARNLSITVRQRGVKGATSRPAETRR